MDVVDKAAGEFSIGGGYATGGETPGPTAEFSITEKNFLGRGQYIRLSLGGGRTAGTTSFPSPNPISWGGGIGRVRPVQAEAYQSQL